MDAFRKFVREHHALYVLFWPVNLVLWFGTEKLALGRAFIIHSTVDDLIPFCEVSTIFYVLWYPFCVFMMVYCFIAEPETFRRMSLYFILTFTVCILIYFFVPTAIDFQPRSFERDNVLVAITRLIYRIDEPTNVLPSEHVIGAFAVFFAALDSKRFRGAKRSVPIFVLAVLISISIMFTKQHSFWDLVAALPLCLIGWIVCFKPFKRKSASNTDALPPG